MRFFVLIALTAVIFGAFTPAAGQEIPNATAAGNTTVPGTITATPTLEASTSTPATSSRNQTGPQNLTQVSSNIYLVESGYNEQTGEAWVKLRARDHSATVTVSDGGAISEGSGEIDNEKVALHPGETTRVSVPVTKVDGMVAVIIANENVLYGELIEPQSNLPWEETTPMSGWLGGATAVIAMTTLAAYRYVNREPDEPEPIA